MNSKEDEDISIDFSRIKGFFKGKKEEKKVDENPQEKASVSAENKDDSGNKEGEDISIDFGKVKSFFKSGDKEEKSTVKEPASKEDELSFDFSRVKKIFSGEKSKSDDDEHIDWKKFADFFRKYGVVFLALVPVILSIYIRMQGSYLPFTDDWAANTVMNGIRSNIRGVVDRDFPNLPDTSKNAIVEKELSKALRENKGQIDATIRQYANSFRQFYQDEKGRNYMPDIDPYYWVRYAENIIKNGHPGDAIKDNKPFDTHQLAPAGRFVFPDMFHSYSIAYFYKLVKLFSPDATVMHSSYYLPVVISAISVLIVFLIGRGIAGNMGGFFAGLMMAANGAFLGRTLFAHADNDVWVIFFPVLITWLFMAATNAKRLLNLIIVTALAGFFTGMYTSAWSGWWYIFDFLIITIVITVAYLVLVNFREIILSPRSLFANAAIRNEVIFLVVYFVSTAVFVVIFSGWSAFKNSLLGPLGFSYLKAPVQTLSLWPNVLTTVAELNEGSVNAIVNSVGGPFLFFLSLVGLILAVSRSEKLKRFDIIFIIGAVIFYGILFINFGTRNSPRILYQTLSLNKLLIWIAIPIAIRIAYSIYTKDRSYDFRLSILLSLWFVSTIFASIKGVRFTLLLAPAFCVAFGVALGKLFYHFSGWLSRELKIHKTIGSSIFLVLILLLYVNPIKGAINTASYDIPIINDAWYNTLTAIKQDSKPDAIITSWWDFGHHFKYIADRPVTFDGTTQTFPPAHWVGKLLMTDNETVAIEILRMLDCGSDNAYNELYKTTDDIHSIIRLLNQIIVLDKEKAQKKLKDYNLNEEQIKKVLSLTHCEPPEGYFIASEDMIGKSGVWSHFGSWSFERADLWKNVRLMPEDKAIEYMASKFNYTKQHAQNIYQEMKEIENEPDQNRRDRRANEWVAPWPGYQGSISCNKDESGIYSCSPLDVGNNIRFVFKVNMTSHDIFTQFQDKILRPSSAAFTTEDGMFKKRFSDTVTGHGMTVVPISENELQIVISSDELAGSMFTRMFFMQGHGLRYFKLFKHERGFTGTNIYTYKVDWEGKNTTIVKEYADVFKKPAAKEIVEPIQDAAEISPNESQ